MKDQNNKDDAHSLSSDKILDEPARKMAYDYRFLQDGDHRFVSALQDIQELCTKPNVKEPKTLMAVQCIIEDGISSISRIER